MCDPLSATAVGATLGGAIAPAAAVTTLGSVTAAVGSAFTGVSSAFASLTSGQLFFANLAIGVAQQAFGFISDSANADAQQDFLNQQAANDQIAADNALRFESNTAILDQLAREEGASQEITQAAIAGAAARSRAKVAAGEAGVAGLSIDALQRDFGASEARFRSGVQANIDLSRQSTRDRLEAAATKQDSRSRSASNLRATPVPRPSFFGAAIRVSGSAFDDFRKFNTDAQGRSRSSNVSTFLT